MKRWLRGREVRKFLRSKLAVTALGIIGIYVAIAAWVLISGEDFERATERRVGPSSLPGWGLPADASERLDQDFFVLERVDRALAQDSAESRAMALDLGMLRLAEKPDDELIGILDEVWERLQELNDREVRDDDEALARFDAIEERIDDLFAELPPWQRFWHEFQLLLGTDQQGRSILLRALYSVKVAFLIGFVTALVSVLMGSVLGAAAAYFGGKVDMLVVWLYSTFSSVPSLVLLTVLAFAFTGSAFENTLIPVYVAFCMTFWIGPCRVVRGEVLKIKELEYVQAASVAGFRRSFILFRHVIPNTTHLLFINFSLLFIGAIKSEVILSFLGLGVKGKPSWGIMISQSSEEVVKGFFWQIGAATFFMFGLVLAFNIVSDTLQDAFDPRHV